MSWDAGRAGGGGSGLPYLFPSCRPALPDPACGKCLPKRASLEHVPSAWIKYMDSPPLRIRTGMYENWYQLRASAGKRGER